MVILHRTLGSQQNDHEEVGTMTHSMNIRMHKQDERMKRQRYRHQVPERRQETRRGPWTPIISAKAHRDANQEVRGLRKEETEGDGDDGRANRYDQRRRQSLSLEACGATGIGRTCVALIPSAARLGMGRTVVAAPPQSSPVVLPHACDPAFRLYAP